MLSAERPHRKDLTSRFIASQPVLRCCLISGTPHGSTAPNLPIKHQVLPRKATDRRSNRGQFWLHSEKAFFAMSSRVRKLQGNGSFTELRSAPAEIRMSLPDFCKNELFNPTVSKLRYHVSQLSRCGHSLTRSISFFSLSCCRPSPKTATLTPVTPKSPNSASFNFASTAPFAMASEHAAEAAAPILPMPTNVTATPMRNYSTLSATVFPEQPCRPMAPPARASA